jgi:hypothetical protein
MELRQTRYGNWSFEIFQSLSCFMKRIFLHLITLFFTGVVVFISCQKEISCEGCKDGVTPNLYSRARMEIYNSVSNTWYFSDLTQPLYSSSVIGTGGQIYVAGGALNSSYTNYTGQVWWLQF